MSTRGRATHRMKASMVSLCSFSFAWSRPQYSDRHGRPCDHLLPNTCKRGKLWYSRRLRGEQELCCVAFFSCRFQANRTSHIVRDVLTDLLFPYRSSFRRANHGSIPVPPTRELPPDSRLRPTLARVVHRRTHPGPRQHRHLDTRGLLRGDRASPGPQSRPSPKVARAVSDRICGVSEDETVSGRREAFEWAVREGRESE